MIQHDEQWYKDWFDNHFYGTVYQHRSQEDADRAVELLLRVVPLERGDAVLDVCCGAGRHLKALVNAGLHASGIDLSANLLRLAAEELPASVVLHQGDMRRPYPAAPYKCITNFFTSFGYFDDDADNQEVLHRFHEALEPKGWLFFDFLNAANVRELLVSEDERELEGMRVRQERWIDERFVNKRITITDEEANHHTFTEQVRLYDLEDFSRMFAKAKLRIREIFGDYDGSAYHDNSPRLIITARSML